MFRLISPYIRIGWESAILGIILAVVGVNTSSAAYFSIGASLAIVGAGMALRSFLGRTSLRDEVVSRISYSLIGALLLTFWLLPFDALNWLTGELEGNIEMFILSGVFVTAAAVWVVMYNSEIIFWPVNRFLGSVGGLRPVLKAALAYPMEAKFRTGLTVAMFALIVFTLMVFAVINEAFSNTIVSNVDRINGGYDIEATVSRELPIDDINAAIESADEPELERFRSSRRFHRPVRRGATNRSLPRRGDRRAQVPAAWRCRIRGVDFRYDQVGTDSLRP